MAVWRIGLLGLLGVVAGDGEVTVSLDSGVYTGTQVVVLAATGDAGGDEVRYTFNGGDPVTEGAVYRRALRLYRLGGNRYGGYSLKAVAVNAAGNATTAIVEKRYLISTSVSRVRSVKSGVLFQAFNWTSSEISTPERSWYKIVKSRYADLRRTFSWVWFPPASQSGDGHGYHPDRLNVLSSKYGTEAELKAAVAALRPARCMADVVINHRVGHASWGGFEDPTMGVSVAAGEYPAIAQGDEGFTSADSAGDPMHGVPMDRRGWPDTGTNYAAARDLDHTNINVQAELLVWMNDRLRKDIGFRGWRYDFVKGFAPEYVGAYNTKSRALLSVGEFWDYDAVKIGTWIEGTAAGGQRSKAFDFPLKNRLNTVFNAPAPDYTVFCQAPSLLSPSDLISFVSNHDTAPPQAHAALAPGNIYLAYGFILTHPSMPSVFWDHFYGNQSSFPHEYGRFYGQRNRYSRWRCDKPIATLKAHIETLISIRRNARITPRSRVVVKACLRGEYAAEVGGRVAVRIGGGSTYSPGNGWGIVYTASNMVVWIKGFSPVTRSRRTVMSEGFEVASDDGRRVIDTNKGTLQMIVNNYLPRDATLKDVVWSVNESTGRATISRTGLLTAVGNGRVTVRATSVDGSQATNTEPFVVDIFNNTQYRDVVFTFHNEGAEEGVPMEAVQLKGEMTVAQPWALIPMVNQGGGRWTVTVTNIPSGAYRWGLEAKGTKWVPRSGDDPIVTVTDDGDVKGNMYTLPYLPTTTVTFTVLDPGMTQPGGVVFKGSATGWNSVPMTQATGGAWVVTITDAASGEWGVETPAGQWLILGPNLAYTVAKNRTISGTITYTIPQPVNVTFTVIDETLSKTGLRFKGTATEWAEIPMTQSATNPGQWTVVVTDMGSGEWGAVDHTGAWLIVGPNPAYIVDKSGAVTGTVRYTIPALTLTDVTFTVVDGTKQHVAIFFRGAATGWMDVPMTVDGDHKWTVTLEQVGSGEWGAVDENGRWLIAEGTPNPKYEVTAAGAVEGTVVYNLDGGEGASGTAVFTVVDQSQSLTAVEIKGSTITNWAALPMYDDGTHGDLAPNDHTWSIAIYGIPSGPGQWGAADSQTQTWLITGPNLEYSVDSTTGDVSGSTHYSYSP